MAAWLQPLIEGQVLSRDQVADLVKEKWPTGGFDGTFLDPNTDKKHPYHQSVLPERSTVMAALKDIEERGKLTRASPPRGRKSKSKI
jgi:hypothetical protein